MSEESDRKEHLARAVAHLDDVELDSAWNAALRGDIEGIEIRLKRVRVPERGSQHGSEVQPWRETSSWLFGRQAFPGKKA